MNINKTQSHTRQTAFRSLTEEQGRLTSRYISEALEKVLETGSPVHKLAENSNIKILSYAPDRIDLSVGRGNGVIQCPFVAKDYKNATTLPEDIISKLEEMYHAFGKFSGCMRPKN